jgi:hypothetical protein
VERSRRGKLAQYVVYRKAILSFLAERLKRRGDGNYHLEKSIHEIVLPLNATSGDVPAERLNLWLIDEKLAYHYYLASDKRLKDVDVIDVDSKDRPDLLIFNTPFAFTDSHDCPFGSVIIVEFKRPMRADYDDKDNPIDQVYRYVRQIRDGKALDRQGRLIPVTPSTPFYAYIIADPTPALRVQAENATFSRTPDTQGYIGFNANLGVYVEIISFEKLLNDARKRNAILFDKLHIPYSM